MTATGREAKIMDALFARAALMATQGPILPVSLPEQAPAFTVPSSGKYLDVQFLPNAPAWEGLAAGKVDQGLMQVMVVWPRGLGQVAPLNAAGQVAAWFPKGLLLYATGLKVKITREPVVAPPLTDPDKCRVPVTLYWTAS